MNVKGNVGKKAILLTESRLFSCHLFTLHPRYPVARNELCFLYNLLVMITVSLFSNILCTSDPPTSILNKNNFCNLGDN